MPESLIEELPKIVAQGKREAQRILDSISKRNRITLQTNELVLPTKAEGGLSDFTGQAVKKLGKRDWFNRLIYGDNLLAMQALLAGNTITPSMRGKIDLIYIDPPFDSKADYRTKITLPGTTIEQRPTVIEQFAYSDTWKDGTVSYLKMLIPRLILMREFLSEQGSIYVHIDWHVGHYVKVIMDEIFGKENFRNEIVVKRTRTLKGELKKFHTSTDAIFFYAKNTEYLLFNGFKKEKENPEWVRMHLPGTVKKDPERVFFGKKLMPPPGRKWVLSQEAIDKAMKEGLIRWDEKLNEPLFLSKYKMIGSDWTDIPGYTFNWNYPTENSEPLLERIVKASSNEGDIVLDAFAGSGTTGAVAEKLGRRWIMIDSSKFAIYTMIKRMLNLKEKIGNKGKPLKPKPFAVHNAGLYDMKILKKLPFKEYRKFALELFQCKDEPHTLAGIELDGYLGQDHVLVFKWKKNGNGKTEYVMDGGFIDNLHSILGNRIGKRFFIVAPAASVVFLEDYIEEDGIRYYVLRIPYSIIDELHKKNFKVLKQPTADMNVNDVMEQVGFDFIYPPDVECEYYIEQPKGKIFKEAVIKIKDFRSNIISKKPIPEEELGLKSLSMVMIDYDYNGEYFDMDDKWFVSDLEKNNYEIRFPVEKLTDRMMIIYMDVFGNERKEIKGKKNFR